MNIAAPNDPLSRFSIGIFTVNGLLMRSGEGITRPVGQSSARWQVLGRAGHSPQTIAEMARSIGNSRQSVQRIAHALVRDGLAVFHSNPKDKRAPLLVLTPEGGRVLQRIYELDDAWSQELLTTLDPKELVRLADSLEAIGHILEKYIESHENKEGNI